MTPHERLAAILEELSTMLHLSRESDSYYNTNHRRIAHSVRWLCSEIEYESLVSTIKDLNLCEENVILDLIKEPYFKETN